MGLGQVPEVASASGLPTAPRGAAHPTSTPCLAPEEAGCQQVGTGRTSFVKLIIGQGSAAGSTNRSTFDQPHRPRPQQHRLQHHSRAGPDRKSQWAGDNEARGGPFNFRPRLGPGWARRVSMLGQPEGAASRRRVAGGDAANGVSGSLSLLEARKRVIRKYRKFTRHVEYQRLKSVVPSVSDRKYVSKVKILHEAIKYIDLLHTKLVTAIHTKGVPPILHQESCCPPKSYYSTSDSSAGAAANRCTQTGISPENTIAMIQKALQPQLEKRLEMKRRMDRAAMGALISSLSAAAAAERGRRPRSTASPPSSSPSDRDEVEDQPMDRCQ